MTCFLALTPGHTVRERLAVLDPAHPDNIYDEMRMLPENKRSALGAVKMQVLNFHAFHNAETGSGKRPATLRNHSQP